MIEPTKNEVIAMEATLASLGNYVASIGINRPLADYSRQEVLALIETVVTAYQDNIKQQFLTSDEISF